MVRPPGLTLSQEKPVLSETPCVCLTHVSVCGVWEGVAFCFVAPLETQGHLYGWEPGVSHTLQGCLLLKDAQAGALRGQGATWLRSLCPAGKHASGPFLSIGQMATLCFCLFDFSQSVRECYIEKESTCLRHVSNVENVKEQLGSNSRLTGTGVCQYFLK